MPNKYSQQFNTPFVPTYVPPNFQAIGMGANDLQNQRDTSLLQYDKLTETMNSAMGELAEQDKPLLQKGLQELQKGFTEIYDASTFKDARPAIRKKAMEFSSRYNSGDIYKARRNMSTLTDNFEKIDKSDWSPELKRRLRDQYLNDYQGVEAGDKIEPIFDLPKYADVNDKAIEFAKDIQPQTYEQYGFIFEQRKNMVTGEIEEVLTDKSGKIKTRIRESEAIKTIVESRIKNDPKIMDYIRAEAEIMAPDNPQEYIDGRINLSVATAVASQTIDDRTISDVSSGTEFKSEDPYTAGTIDIPGSLMNVRSFIPNDYSDFMGSMRTAFLRSEEDPDTFQAKKSALNHTLSQMKNEGIITAHDMNRYLESLHTNEYVNLTPENKDYNVSIGTSGRETDILRRIQERQNNSKTLYETSPKFKEVQDKINSFVENRGDIISNNVIFKDDTKSNHFRNVFARSINPRSFDIVNEELDENEKIDLITEIKDNIDDNKTTPQISYTDDAIFYEVSYINDDGDSKNYILEEKIQDSSIYENSVTNYVTELIGGPRGRKLNKVFALRSVNTYSGENIFDKLPQSIKSNARDIDFIKMDLNTDGTIMNIGTKDNHAPYNYFNYLIDNAPGSDNPDKSIIEFNRIIDEINRELKGFFTTEELAKLRTLPVDDSVSEWMNGISKLKDPYPFIDKVHAISYAIPD